MIDLHAHLDLYPNPKRVVAECVARRMYVLSVTNTPSAWPETARLAEGADRIRTAIGLHPQLAHLRRFELSLFDRHLLETRYVGEIGLDGAPEFKRYWEDQVAVFRHILAACSKVGGRIMTIHSRRAAGAVLDELCEHPGAGVPILHWFSGSKRELERAISQGCWFSVGPAMLLSKKSRDLVRLMPIERTLTETDGPFAQVEGAQAWPWDVGKAISALAPIWNFSEAQATDKLLANLRQLVAHAKNFELPRQSCDPGLT